MFGIDFRRKIDFVVQKRDLEIGFCPQFDWLVNNLSVIETLTLFAR